MQFVYAGSVLSPGKPDELFQEEAQAIRESGHTVSVIDVDELETRKAPIRPAIKTQPRVVYRGWMLKPAAYDNLLASIAAYSSVPLTHDEEYLAAHYLPNWYPCVARFTPETVVLPHDESLLGSLQQLGWERFFIKDYVKSLKTSVGSLIERPEDIHLLIAEMVKYRGEIEGGLCVRRVETFLPQTERRYFVIGGTPYAAEPTQPIPDLVFEAARLIKSPFFSVDVMQRADGVERIVEIGDGQVSDLTGWTVGRFAQIWQQAA